MKERIILNAKKLDLTIKRLCYQLVENHNDFQNSVIIGLQPRGVYFAKRIHKDLCDITGNHAIQFGAMDTTFHRDDFRRRDVPIIPNSTKIDFIIENKRVVLIDDVLYTGRTIRAGMDAMLAFGRPDLVELMVLIDRRFSRHLPIQPNYTGKIVDTIAAERVKVEWKEAHKKDQVVLYTPERKN
jgi:pyrimidine operon attenuation protein/uracil phosphoribosyltransferase